LATLASWRFKNLLLQRRQSKKRHRRRRNKLEAAFRWREAS
jgi:hypothetical protein